MQILVQVRLIGTGTDADHYRAALPTYRQLTVSDDGKSAIVSVDTATLGLSADDLAKESPHPTDAGPLYTQLSAENLTKVKGHLAKAYPGSESTLEFANG